MSLTTTYASQSDAPTRERKELHQKRDLGCCATVLLLPVGALWKAWVFLHLWLWFLVPLGVPTITYAHSLGLGLLVSMLRMRGTYADQDEALAKWVKEPGNRPKLWARMWMQELVLPGVYLVLGWVVQRWAL